MMLTRRLLLKCGAAGVALAGVFPRVGARAAATFEVMHSDAEWRAMLSPEAYAVLRQEAAGVYGSVRHYLQAVKAAGTVDADVVMAKMKSLPIDDPFSINAHIREDGLVVRDMMLAQVKTPAQSKGPWDYYNIVSNIPGDTLAWPLADSQCPLVKR